MWRSTQRNIRDFKSKEGRVLFNIFNSRSSFSNSAWMAILCAREALSPSEIIWFITLFFTSNPHH